MALNRLLAVAPMMDWTDRHCRYFFRILSPNALLYTEMVTTGALLHGDAERWLAYHPQEHPLALQLGGSDPQALAQCSRLAADWGYDEVNLNVGCPSDRVQNGRFGACLMAEPALVADCVAAMQAAVTIPVTVKTRVGIDQLDSYDYFASFVRTVAAAGCRVFIIHARKAWLKGLNPKQNREIPELRYDWVHRLKREFPELTIILNGGLTTVAEVEQQLPYVDGVMIGRAAYHDPYFLARLEQALDSTQSGPIERHEVLLKFLPYIEQQLQQGVYLKHMARHILGLFQGLPGAKHWRRYLSQYAHQPGADVNVVRQAAQPFLLV